MSKVLITGVSGFLGLHAANHFLQNGWSVVGIDRLPVERKPDVEFLEYYSLDLPSPNFGRIIQDQNPHLVIHCAGLASVDLSILDPEPDYLSGPALVFDLLNNLRIHKSDCQFILISSAAVYGNPTQLPVTENQEPAPLSPYGYHKWQAELLCQEFSQVYGLSTCSVRVFSAYGPGLRRQVIWDICNKILKNKSLILHGTGKESRDFIHVEDITHAFEIISKNADMNGEVYNLANGQDISISRLADLICEHLGSKLEPAFDGSTHVGNPNNWKADITKIKNLGFEPLINFDDGIKNVVNWCKSELI